MKLPRVLRAARSRAYPYQNPHRELDSFNRGFYDSSEGVPDGMRGNVSIGGDHRAALEQMSRDFRGGLGRR